MFDLDSEEQVPGRQRINWLEGVRKANLKADCATPHLYRLFGPMMKVAIHQVEWYSDKKKDTTGYPALCPRLNPRTGKLDRTYPADHPEAGKLLPCPYCEGKVLPARMPDGSLMKPTPRDPKIRYLAHAIDRKVQWGIEGCVTILDLPETVVVTIYNKKKVNEHMANGQLQQFSIAHPDFGRDMYLTFDPKASAQNMYTIDLGGHSPLQPHERQAPRWDLMSLYETKGFLQADPEELTGFLQRIHLLPDPNGQAGATRMPGGPSFGGPSFGDVGRGDIPTSFGGGFPGAQGGGFPGAQPGGFPAQGGFPGAQPGGFPAQGGFQQAQLPTTQAGFPAAPAGGGFPAAPAGGGFPGAPGGFPAAAPVAGAGYPAQPGQGNFQQPLPGFQQAQPQQPQTTPSTRFSGPPQTEQPAMPQGMSVPQTAMPGSSFQAAIAGPGGHAMAPGPMQLPVVQAGGQAQGYPACFRDKNSQGLPPCAKCPVVEACEAE